MFWCLRTAIIRAWGPQAASLVKMVESDFEKGNSS